MSTEALQPDEKAIGVVGAGRMGAAIAQIFAAEGFSVLLIDPSEDARRNALARIAEISRKRGGASDLPGQIRLYSDLPHELSSCALVIEAAPEKTGLKQELFERMDHLCAGDTILASNTSVIPIGELAARVKRRGRVVGTHFWNPPYAVRLVEVVQARDTSDETVERAMALLKRAGQSPVRVNKDVPGFIGNRLQHALKREAIALVQNGVCDAETVDFVVRNSFGARLAAMGPLEQSDLVGLNLTLDIHKVILRDLDCSKEPQQLLVDKVALGHVGASVGQGFRKWTPQERDELQERLDRALLPPKSAAK